MLGTCLSDGQFSTRTWLSFGCAAKARHDGRRPIALPSSWPRCYPRNRAEPIVETHHLSRRYTRVVRHVAAPFDQAAAQTSLTERCRGRGGDIPYGTRPHAKQATAKFKLVR